MKNYYDTDQALEQYIEEGLFLKLKNYLETGKNYKSVYSLRLKKSGKNGVLQHV